MSSRGRCQDSSASGSGHLISSEALEDDVAQVSAEGSDRLGLGVAGGHPLRDIGAAWTLALELGDGDPMEGDVELTIATAIESMADVIARPDRYRRGAVVPGERGSRPEATDTARLADELGRSQVAAAGERQQRRRDLFGEAPDLALKAVDRGGQLADPGDEITGKASHGLDPAGEVGLQAIEDDPPIERARRWLVDAELDEEPAQALLVAGAIGHQIFTVVDQKPQLALHAIQPGDRQIGFAKCRAGD